jgi:hypothetical protein
MASRFRWPRDEGQVHGGQAGAYGDGRAGSKADDEPVPCIAINFDLTDLDVDNFGEVAKSAEVDAAARNGA